MENAHFMVWMRDAALPNFRKLYARIDQDIVLPLTVSLVNRKENWPGQFLVQDILSLALAAENL